MPTGRITIYDNDGTPLTDIRASVTRSWVLNGVGQADFAMAYYDIKCRRRFLQYGNLIKIEHTDLPDWLGVIDVPRDWGPNYLTVRAYEMGHLLRYRRTEANRKLTGTAGEIAKQLLGIANSEGDTYIRQGSFYGGGTDREETLGDSVYTHFDNVRKRSGNEWRITPDIENRKLVGTLDWVQRAGRDVTRVILNAKNTETSSYRLREDGTIINSLMGYGDTDSAGTRISYEAENRQSINRYGLRQVAKTYSGNKELSTLQTNVDAEVARYANPPKLFQAVCLDVGNTFRALRLGNRLTVDVPGVGFSDDGLGYKGSIRIIGMRYSDASDRVELMTSEETEITD